MLCLACRMYAKCKEAAVLPCAYSTLSCPCGQHLFWVLLAIPSPPSSYSVLHVWVFCRQQGAWSTQQHATTRSRRTCHHFSMAIASRSWTALPGAKLTPRPTAQSPPSAALRLDFHRRHSLFASFGHVEGLDGSLGSGANAVQHVEAAYRTGPWCAWALTACPI